VRYDGEAPRLTADFEVATPRLPVAPDRVEDLGLELANVRRPDPDPEASIEGARNEKRDMNGAQPSIGVFVRSKCWLAGRAARAAGSHGDAPTGAVHGEPAGGAAASSHGGQSCAGPVSPSNHRVDNTSPPADAPSRGEAAARTSPGRW
jgi:hypothetical protein